MRYVATDVMDNPLRYFDSMLIAEVFAEARAHDGLTTNIRYADTNYLLSRRSAERSDEYTGFVDTTYMSDQEIKMLDE